MKSLCPAVYYPRFDDEDSLRFSVQKGSVFLGWSPQGKGSWGMVVYGRPNGAGLDFEDWTLHRGTLNKFITVPNDAIFLGVALDGDVLFLTLHR